MTGIMQTIQWSLQQDQSYLLRTCSYFVKTLSTVATLSPDKNLSIQMQDIIISYVEIWHGVTSILLNFGCLVKGVVTSNCKVLDTNLPICSAKNKLSKSTWHMNVIFQWMHFKVYYIFPTNIFLLTLKHFYDICIYIHNVTNI